MNVTATTHAGGVPGGHGVNEDLIIKDGFIVDPRVVDKRVAALEHGAMTRVDAIVLHQPTAAP